MLKSEVSSLDGVHEALRDEYVRDGDVWRLKVDGYISEAEVGGLKSALDKEKERRRELMNEKRAMADELEKISTTKGISSKEKKELDKLRDQIETQELKDAERRGEFEKVRNTMLEKHTAELESLKTQLASEKGERVRQDLTFTALSHIATHHGVPELLLPVIEKQTEWRNVDGKQMHAVLDENRETRFNDKGQPMGVGEFIESLKDDSTYGLAFLPSGDLGTGSPPVRSRSFEKGDSSKMSSDQKIQQGLEELERK